MNIPPIEPIIDAAQAGGKIIRNYFGKSIETVQKSTTADFQTLADLESEAEILKILIKAFPSYNIFSEETGAIDNGSDYQFIIDPMDGTHNFTMGIPNFTVSIGLMYKDTVIVGVVHSVMTQET